VYLEVEEDTVSPAPCLTLANDDDGHGYGSGVSSVLVLSIVADITYSSYGAQAFPS
jgi:hypothetical protein